jgi:MFS family permease
MRAASARRHHHPLRRNLRASVLDAALFSVMVGLGETYFSAYVLALDGGEIAAGLMLAIPLMAGACLQLLTPWLVKRWIPYQPWVVGTAVLQGISVLMMPLASLAGAQRVTAAFVAASFYWGAGLAAGPAWNTWIEGIVPRRVRTRFFAFRVRVSQACILLGFVLGGFLLQYGKEHRQTLETFTLVFLVAAVCRLLSSWFLSRHLEAFRRRRPVPAFAPTVTTQPENRHSSHRLLAYLFAVQVAAFIAGPYFVPFMLSKLEFSYRDYALLIGLTYVGKVVALPAWGRLAHFTGPHRLLWIGGLSIVPISGFWMVSQNMVFLGVLQLAGGVTWAAYELAILLMFFESIPRSARTTTLTIYNFGNSLSQVAGALLGAVWLRHFGKSFDAYLWLFVASSVARAAAATLLTQVPKPRLIDEVLKSSD